MIPPGSERGTATDGARETDGVEAVGPRVGVVGAGVGSFGTDTVGTVGVGTDGVDTVGVGSGVLGTVTVGTETVGTETVGTETVGTETVGMETVGTERVESARLERGWTPSSTKANSAARTISRESAWVLRRQPPLMVRDYYPSLTNSNRRT